MNIISIFQFSRMHIRATTEISKGSQLYSCYTYTLNGTMDRQQHLMEGKYFRCHCERCLDPTELDTHFSSMKCRECLYGDVDSSNPLGNIQHRNTIFLQIGKYFTSLMF